MDSFINDRTWPLIILIENDSSYDDTYQEELIRVRGDFTIGTCMALIGEKIASSEPKDLSDYALWWPAKKRWLKQFRMTLDQVDVIANTRLIFTTMHKTLRIQFPDLNIEEFKVDFSANLLNVVSKLCQSIDINHPEELSLARPLTNKELKRNNPNLDTSPLQKNNNAIYETLQFNKNNGSTTLDNNNTLNLMNNSNGSNNLSNRSISTISSNGSINGSNYSLTTNLNNDNRDILLPHPKTFVQRARLNSAWLNSSISLMEQNVSQNDLLLLKFKFYTFLDLNPTQLTRVNYLYEQLKWQILREEISCTEDEMYTLAGLMLQVTHCSGKVIPINGHHNHHNGNSNHHLNNNNNNNNGTSYYLNSPSLLNKSSSINNNNGHGSPSFYGNGGSIVTRQNSSPRLLNGSLSSSTTTSDNGDEVDNALESLERQLLGTEINSNGKNYLNGNHHNHHNGKNINDFNRNLMIVPKLMNKLKISCQKLKTNQSTLSRLTTKYNSEKQYFVVFSETILNAYRLQDFDQQSMLPLKQPIISLNMQQCEINPEVIASQQKYYFKIIDSKSSYEYCIKCSDEQQYAQWFTACKQASHGKTMASASYKEQFQNTLKLLTIQSKVSTKNSKDFDKKELKKLLEIIDPSYFIAPRFLKRRSKEQIIAKIKTAHENFQDETLIDAQMNFIKTCQTLKDYGITLFIVRFHRSNKKEELLGAMPDKLVLIDLNNGKLKKTWRYKTMIMWNINWEVKRMKINFNDEILEFECLSADCKVIHEFIGGYIYMSMREKENLNENNNYFNEEQFLKLIGGWNDSDLIENGDDDDDDNNGNNDDEHIQMCRREAWHNNYNHQIIAK